ncbi:MAG: recombinase family protein, partial [Cyclobacteriaceae bacterium]
MKKAVIYGRVSTSIQDFGRQIDDLDEWAKKHGYEVVGRFAEKISGATKGSDREEYNKMIDFINENQIKMILVSELSRVGRLGVHTRFEIETLAEKGVNMFFYDKNSFSLDNKGNVDSQTMMVIGISSDLAKIEVDRIRERVISGLKNSARNGKIQGSKFKRYGFYGDKDKNIIVNDEELKVVEMLFNFFDKGMTTNNITAWLNDQGIATRYNDFTGTLIRGKKAETYTWNTRTVYRILTNRMFIGERHHKGELVHKSEPIIDPELFQRVQEKIKQRSNTSIKVIKNNNYLKGVIKCQCGCGMFYNKHEKKRVNSYVCLSKAYSKLKKQSPCKHPNVNIDKLLNSLYDVLMVHFIKKLKGKEHTNDLDERIDLKRIELSNASNELKKSNQYLKNVNDDYNKRVIKQDYFVKRTEELEIEMERLNKTFEELNSEINMLVDAKNKPIKSFYTKEMFLAETRNIIKSVTIGT